MAGEGSHFYRLCLHYRNDSQMCNIRAYSATYALKEVAEDLLYTPDDILSNESSADTILAEGFHMLLQTKDIQRRSIRTGRQFRCGTDRF